MKSQLSKLVLSIALSLGAIASTTVANAAITITPNGDQQFAPIHAGLTQDEVRRLEGTPERVIKNAHTGESQLVYRFTDTWGYASEFNVNIGADGLVANVSKERLDY